MSVSSTQKKQVTEGESLSSSVSGVSPLRVGVLLSGWVQPRWIAHMLREVLVLPCAEIVLVVLAETGPATRAASSRGRTAAARLLGLYERWTSRRAGDANDPLQATSVADLLLAAPRIAMNLGREPADRDLARLHAADLDVLLDLSGEAAEELAAATRHGLWRYPETADDSAAVAGFWEVMEAAPATRVTLEACLDGAVRGRRVIYESSTRTNQLSAARTRAANCWKAARFVARRLREIHDLGPAALSSADATRTLPAPPPRVPSAVDAIRFVTRMALRRIQNRASGRTSIEQWTLAYAFDPAGEPSVAAGEPFLPSSGLHHLLPPADRSWADPFPVCHEGRHFVFLEEQPFVGRRGVISVVELTPEGPLGDPVPVLSRDYHLAYPFVFRWQGEFFMIPETAENRTIEVYRCKSFPFEWEPYEVLLDGLWAVDATLARVEGSWWMFTAVGVPDEFDCDDELHLFHASSPFGPWTPHRRNPVRSSVSGSRPAGRLFWTDGELYRPAQDCAVRYGHAMVVQNIRRLTATEFEEVPVRTIAPDWAPGLLATHTINRAGQLTVLDGLIRRSRRG